MIIFFGTTPFSVNILKQLVLSGHQVLGVVTQPDRPKGRHLKLMPSPVKIFAQEQNLPLFQPERVKNPDCVEEIRRFKPKLIIVAAFGQILSRELLELPEFGCWNVHTSILPKYRGALPIQRAIMNGESATGITIMQMGEGLDDGDILDQKTCPIGLDETAGELEVRLAELGSDLLLKTLEKLKQHQIKATPQNHSEATYAAKLKKEEREICWDWPAKKIHDLVRALNPAPGAYSLRNGIPLKLWKTECCGTQTTQPGQVLSVSKKELIVGTSQGGLSLKEVQLPGKRQIRIEEFLQGHPLKAGEKFADS